MTKHTILKDHKPTVNAWCSYDGANSVYNLVITSAIFPVYYTSITKEVFNGDTVTFYGMPVLASVLYSYAISAAYLMVVLALPILSGVADYGGTKKRFMQFFTYLGSVACIGLFFFEGRNIEFGILCCALACIGYAGSLVFYNAFLHDIASPEQVDKVSARGFSVGYVVSVVILIVNLVMIIKHEVFGITAGWATKFAFLLVGIWWILFSQIAFYYLKDNPTGHKIDANILQKGFRELKKVWYQLKELPTLKKYLIAFFFYSMGVQTVMLLAPLFGEKVVQMPGDQLILVVLILQLVAVVGAYLFAYLSGKIGNKGAIMIMLFIWIGICLGAYFITTANQFYLLAAVVGLVMGGIQSLSRSTYSKLIPDNTQDSASFFSFYDITEKVAIVLGMFSYGFIEQITGNMRYSALALMLFFLLGFIVLYLNKMPRKG